ncbi:MAG TPA: hypothetical protein VIV06_00400 [Candidatus Limnocylindrales bacterium]
MRGPKERIRCAVCDTLTVDQLAELDTLMGDPVRWPPTVWGVFGKPQLLTAQRRQWGALTMGMAYLASIGLQVISKAVVQRHYRDHTPVIATSTDDLVSAGLIAATLPYKPVPEVPTSPVRFLEYFAKGIEVGIKGLDLLRARIEAIEQAPADAHGNKPEVPMSLITLAISSGSKLALAQASIRARGARLDDDDDDDSFRGAGGEEPGQRIGHHRIRVIEGESRPIRDGGRADRDAYNRTAIEEGAPRL